MIELHVDKYSLLRNPLKEVKINTLFARAVIEMKVRGKVYVDNLKDPKTFFVIHSYGMSLLFGDSQNDSFNSEFVDYCLNKKNVRKSFEWMQAYPSTWNIALSDMFGEKLVEASDLAVTPDGCIELNTRVNFNFDTNTFLAIKDKSSTGDFTIQRTNKNDFDKMKGSVVPSFFWNNAEDFYKNGVGFSLYHQGRLASTAYSAFIFDNMLELGMETIPEFRGRGYAQYVCSALIDYCINNAYEPIWACKLTNTPSYKLAQKLGFVPSKTLPYYRLAL